MLDDRKRHGALAWKMLIPTAVLVVLAVGAVAASVYSVMKSYIDRELSADITNYARMTAENLDSYFKTWGRTTALHAAAINTKDGSIGLGEAGELAKVFVASDNDIVGGGSWWDYYKHDPKTKYAVRYFPNDAGKLKDVSSDYASGQDDFPNDSWFRIVADSKSPSDFRWTDPYHDPVVKIDMVTCSAPFSSPGGKWIGLVTSDISLKTLQKIVSGIKLGSGGYAFLVARNGAFISHPKYAMDDSLLKVDGGAYRELAESLGKG